MGQTDVSLEGIPVRVQVQGRIGLPNRIRHLLQFSVAVAELMLEGHERPIRFASRIRKGALQGYRNTGPERSRVIHLPRRVARELNLPADGVLTLTPAPPAVMDEIHDNPAKGPIMLPDGDGAMRFRATIMRTGIRIPAPMGRGMLVTGWGESVTVRVNGHEFHGRLRFREDHDGRHAGVWIELPLQQLGLKRGEVVAFEFIPREDLVAGVPVSGGRFDWSAFPPEGGRVISLGHGRIVLLRNRHTRFDINRRMDLVTACWLLGAYLAEGQKTGGHWSFTGVLWRYVGEVVRVLLEDVGVAPPQVMIRAVAPPRVYLDRDRIEREIGLPVTHVQRSGRRDQIAITAGLRYSRPFWLATLQAIDWLQREWTSLPVEATRAFVLAYLDGDGSFTLTRREHGWVGGRLGISGDESEVKMVASMLERVFGWPSSGWHLDRGAWTLHRQLTPQQAVDLLKAGAFRFSMSRARLLVGFEKWLRNTPEAEPLVDELEHLRGILGADLDGVVQHKCVEYPLADIADVQEDVCVYTPQREARWRVSRQIPFEVDAQAARATLEAHHYLGGIPAGWTIPLVDPEGGGVAVFSIPANPSLSRFLFGRRVRLLELSRLWSPEGQPPNYLSRFLATCLRGIRRADIADAVVSYADPEAGHIGGIYRATNWIYTGISTPGMVWVKGDERLHRRHFHGSGGSVPDREIVATGYRKVRTSGKHRFVYTFGNVKVLPERVHYTTGVGDNQ
jgi:hypothetical protein